MSDGVTVDVSQLNRLAVGLDHLADDVIEQAEAAVKKTALDIEATGKAFAPVDTGALRNSIGHDIEGDLRRSGRIEAEIGPTVEYAPFVEFGTSRTAPQAFMGPALDRHTPAFITALERLAERGPQ